ncbi:hypothetical protein [Komagataeibacter sp. NFXK3]
MATRAGPQVEEEDILKKIQSLIDFVTPSEEAICLHEAGHACAALMVGLTPEFIELLDDEDMNGRARSRITAGDYEQQRTVACGAFAVEYNLFMAARLTDASGVAINEKVFIVHAIGQNAALDKQKFFAANREQPDGCWPEADDLAFIKAGQCLAEIIQMEFVEALAEALLNEGRLESNRIAEIWDRIP